MTYLDKEVEQRRLLKRANYEAILKGWGDLHLEGDVSGFVESVPILLSGM